jgi:hypothetical protein
MTFSFGSSDVEKPSDEMFPENVICTWPPASLRRKPTEILVTWNRRSLGVSFRTHISSCPRCTVSFSVPVFAEISNTAGRSRDANSAASGLALPGWFGCA